MARLQQHYKETVVQELMDKFQFKSVMQVPKITKITLNMGVGEAIGDKKILENAVGDMEKIAGQKPVVCLARKSVAARSIEAQQRNLLGFFLLAALSAEEASNH